MAYRFFPGASPAWLQAKLAEINEQLAASKIATSSNAGDKGASFQRETSLVTTQQHILWDLWKTDPDGGWDQHLLPTVTRGSFVSRDPWTTTTT